APWRQKVDGNGQEPRAVLASAEADARGRGDYAGLARVFAEAANCRPAWQQALQGWNVIQSQQVLEWMAEGEVKGKAETHLEILDLKFGSVPAEVASAIRATMDLARLKQWVAAAVTAQTLDMFRQSAQL